jgi:hypothetical protein
MAPGFGTKSGQSQQYAQIDFQIDAYVSNAWRPQPVLSGPARAFVSAEGRWSPNDYREQAMPQSGERTAIKAVGDAKSPSEYNA